MFDPKYLEEEEEDKEVPKPPKILYGTTPAKAQVYNRKKFETPADLWEDLIKQEKQIPALDTLIKWIAVSKGVKPHLGIKRDGVLNALFIYLNKRG